MEKDVPKKIHKKKLVIRKEAPQDQAEQNQAQQNQAQQNQAEQNQAINIYISQLTPQEKIVLNIAKEHLETSFDIEKSIGYIHWLTTHKQ